MRPTPAGPWAVASLLAFCLLSMPWLASGAEDGRLNLTLRSRLDAPGHGGATRVVEKAESWDPKRTAIIVCDMWDLHHCLNATRRVEELGPRMNRVLDVARRSGVTIIHAPSDCMAAYEGHPARKRAQETPRSGRLPEGIAQWCRQIPDEATAEYPVDQTDGGEDDDPAEHARWQARLVSMGKKPRAPWTRETPMLTIDATRDYVSVDGQEIWSVLEDRGVDHVLLMGVHLNMCVLGRPFGLRQMAKNGKTVALVRDMTDTMYNPEKAPFLSHFSGTDRVIEHVERHVCPSVTSDQIVGGTPFRFRGDRRPRVAFLIAEDEYKTEATLPAFAARYLARDTQLSFFFEDPSNKNDVPGLASSAMDEADLLVVSARRRVLPREQVAAVRRFVASGKPVVGIRTASHAFATRDKAPVAEGSDAWPTFDPEVLGGHYTGHHGEGPGVTLRAQEGAGSHPILKGVDLVKLVGHGSLYKVSPLATSATPLVVGEVPGAAAEPVVWTNLDDAGGRVVYTSLGHAEDFARPEFARLLRNAIDWALGREASGDLEASSTAKIPFPK